MDNKVLPEIKNTILIHAPIEKVWKTVSTANRIALWFMANNLRAIVGHEFYIGPLLALHHTKY